MPLAAKTTAANNKTATCTVTVNAPLTNAEVLQILNENITLQVAKHWAYNQAIDPAIVTANDYKDVTWCITKDGENMASANIVFTYLRTAKAYHVILYKVDFATPLTPENIKNGNIGTPSYTELYSKSTNPNIQNEHTALTNAICDKLFGENQNATRYIIDDGFVAADPQLGDMSTFTVIEITGCWR